MSGRWRTVYLRVSEGIPCLRRIQQMVNNSIVVDQNYAFGGPGRQNIAACSAEWARQEQIKRLSTLKNATPLSACPHKMGPAFHVEPQSTWHSGTWLQVGQGNRQAVVKCFF